MPCENRLSRMWPSCSSMWLTPYKNRPSCMWPTCSSKSLIACSSCFSNWLNMMPYEYRLSHMWPSCSSKSLTPYENRPSCMWPTCSSKPLIIYPSCFSKSLNVISYAYKPIKTYICVPASLSQAFNTYHVSRVRGIRRICRWLKDCGQWICQLTETSDFLELWQIWQLTKVATATLWVQLPI